MMQDDTNAADILMGDVVRLEDVLSRDSVTSVSRSFFALFGLPVRIISHEGDLLADVHRDRPLCNYLNTLSNGQRACANTVSVVRDLEPNGQTIVHPCFTGAVYRIVPLEYQGRPIGRLIVGPYVPAETQGPPASLLSIDATIDVPSVREHFDRMPRVRQDIAEELCSHLKGVLELLVFSGHRAQLASTMQIANVRENYRELAEKNEALKTSYDELKQVDQLKSTFLATVSHELRTPLTSIIGYTEMLESGSAGALSDGQAEFLKTIRTKADQLLGLISSLLDLGRLEAKNLELHHEAVDPHALLSDVGSTIVPNANRRNVTLDIKVADGAPKIWGDQVRLRQILLNLADNALKFTHEGGEVVLGAEAGELDAVGPSGLGAALFAASRPAVVLTVRDTGMGIPEENLARIFDAFYQIDAGTTRAHGGAGLGLSIVKQLVDGHNGTIEVASALGEGTIFTVRLPAADANA
ncbi:MAG: PocR ligand-binding domain-containing protein [Deltaproteobacteria bacterium]|nr:PocR ligand-binding domain-containing protein [Deltaproteobacteria bacterium]MBW1873766.1 PocR ligand-binding domain-containing protein [Deltaproteobacteria bacterium]MBW2212851.1 PocR ligand-binding domain-containing protein [Deltaproteobacteria bacterium]MBW2549165.1 PocR ligand-binding domain-containing protein [Deltaproteobacteria bacterium]MBW2684286.1 PocR ligand-binding domain-containing protein [Deltaproteobacteria bacterium]